MRYVRYDGTPTDSCNISRGDPHGGELGYATVLDGISADPQEPIAAVPPLEPAARRQVLVDFNATVVEFPRNACIHDLVQAQAEKTPEAIAVAEADRRLTYAELNVRANQLAHYLQARGAGLETPVAVCLQRSAEWIVALLGILKAGSAYVPLDPKYPQERLGFMLADSGAPLVLTVERLRGAVAGFAGKIICVDTEETEIGRQKRRNPGAKTTPNNLAYVIYTSGSAGRPKGVATEHAGVVNLIAWYGREYAVTPSDRTTHLASVAFDASVLEVWPILAAGASLHLPGDQTLAEPRRLARWLAAEKITICFLPTPLAEAVLDEPWPEESALRLLLAGGDRLHRAPRQPLPFRLMNLYGPTENSVAATSGEVLPAAEQEGPPPIGRPIANVRVYVLDESMDPVPVGIAGELHIAGAGLARGYIHHPELTAGAFVPDPFSAYGGRLYKTGDRARWLPDGKLVFLGRLDDQVKIRGFRVELGEIEAVLSQHPQVREQVVLAPEEVGHHVPMVGEKRLVAYVVPQDGQAPIRSELRNHLQGKLPEYMVPSAFVMLDRLPLTPNGKIDRRALLAPGQERPDLGTSYAAPRTAIEEQLAVIWAEALGLERVGIHDNFFDLGGNSLTVMRVAARVHMLLDVELPVGKMFEAATIAELALVLRVMKEQSRVRSGSCRDGRASPGSSAADPGAAIDLVDGTTPARQFRLQYPGGAAISRPAAIAGPEGKPPGDRAPARDTADLLCVGGGCALAGRRFLRDVRAAVDRLKRGGGCGPFPAAPGSCRTRGPAALRPGAWSFDPRPGPARCGRRPRSAGHDASPRHRWLVAGGVLPRTGRPVPRIFRRAALALAGIARAIRGLCPMATAVVQRGGSARTGS